MWTIGKNFDILRLFRWKCSFSAFSFALLTIKTKKSTKWQAFFEIKHQLHMKKKKKYINSLIFWTISRCWSSKIGSISFFGGTFFQSWESYWRNFLFSVSSECNRKVHRLQHFEVAPFNFIQTFFLMII